MTSVNQAAATRGGFRQPSARPREIAFAEDQLRLPQLWQELQQAQAQVEALLQRKSITLLARSNQDEKLAEAERDIELKVIADGDTKSVAARERAIKDALMSDETYQALHAHSGTLRAELDQIDIDLRAVELQHRAIIATLNSASEYMAFLTAARNARSVAEVALPY